MSFFFPPNPRLPSVDRWVFTAHLVAERGVMNGRGEADSPGRGRARFTPHGSASGPCHYWRESAVHAGLAVCSARFSLQAGPRRISSSPVPQTPPLAGWDVLKEPQLSIGSIARPSALIPDRPTARWRWWAGAAKKIIRSFELRLLARLSATMNSEIIPVTVTMNGWWSRGQSRRAQPREIDSLYPTGAEEEQQQRQQQQLVVILTTGGDPGVCLCLCARFCEPLCETRASGGGEERSGAEGATRLVCKPIKVESHTTSFTSGIFCAPTCCDGVSEVQGM